MPRHLLDAKKVERAKPKEKPYRLADGDGHGALPPELSEFTRQSIAIDESTPPALLPERLMLNCSLVIKSRKPQPHALRSAGLGLLRL